MAPPPGSDVSLLRDLLARRAISFHFQPILHLASGRTVGYEALARGPAGTQLELPSALFRTARRAGLLAELDQTCCAAGRESGIQAGIRPPLALFLNIEPEGMGSPLPRSSGAYFLPFARSRVFFEVTERALALFPGLLLRRMAHARAWGCGIALDDVGANQQSLAIMPKLDPDIVKLDLAVLKRSSDALTVIDAVADQASQSRAVVLAEKIETQDDLDFARSLGATLGQGFLLGRPRPSGLVRPLHRASTGSSSPQRPIAA